jgi:hypothetical protein
MAQDHNDIYSIVERLRMLEEGLTPVTVKHGLNAQQKSVDQLSATFKPKTVAVLTAKQDPKNPLAGKLVGDDVENDKEPVEEAVATEDVLDKVKSSFVDYLKSIEDRYKDSNLKDKVKVDRDLGKKDPKDRDLVAKVKDAIVAEKVEKDSTVDNPDEQGDYDDQEDLPSDRAYDRGESPYDAPEPQIESQPVKTVTNECGLWEVHGDEPSGFEIRHGNRAMRSRFKTIDEAVMALEMFAARKKIQDESQDYIEEA